MREEAPGCGLAMLVCGACLYGTPGVRLCLRGVFCVENIRLMTNSHKSQSEKPETKQGPGDRSKNAT